MPFRLFNSPEHVDWFALLDPEVIRAKWVGACTPSPGHSMAHSIDRTNTPKVITELANYRCAAPGRGRAFNNERQLLAHLQNYHGHFS
eukprot:8361421-Pyramimonas_sp.AAC.1